MRILLGFLFLGGCVTPPPPASVPEPGAPAEARAEAVLEALEARAKEVLARIDHPLDRASWEAAVPRLRKQLAVSLGLAQFPPAQPRALRRVGLLERTGYSLEKLVYETLPGVEVPAHLYLPSPRAEKKHPAILFVPGHWWADSKTRPDFQAFCIQSARMGFVVLSYDPFGQGERGISLRDHRRTETLLAGVAQQAVVDFESLCALELLLARPDVDPARVGITGASGGGYNSWVMAALDGRIAASVPVVGTSEFGEQISVCRPLDWYTAKEHCHFVPGLLRYANNHEFAAMIAPRPLMVIAAHNDQSFPMPGIREVAGYARRLYGALGRPERFGYFEDDREGHGYQKRKREAAYGWFLRWLAGEGDGGPVEEPPLEIPAWDSAELRCFPEKRGAGEGINAWARELLAKRAPPPKPEAVPGLLAGALGLEIPARLTSAPKLRGTEGRVSWTMRDGVTVPGLLTAGTGRGALIAAADAGKESLADDPVLRDARAAGLAVLACDPRGTGELAVSKPGWVFATSLLLGENFVGRQALDLVAGWRALRARIGDQPIGFYGNGPSAALAALYAAVLEPRAAFLVTDGGFTTWRAFAIREAMKASYALAAPGQEKTVALDREIPHALVLFDAARKFDISDLYRSLEPRPVRVLGWIDGDFKPMPGEPLAFGGLLPPPAEPRPPSAPTNVSAPVERGMMPARVHVVEDYETDIERRWWLAGMPEAGVCRGTLANDFDDKQGDPSKLYTAVIFNPVPGPPMGPRTRLAFRCRIDGSDRLRVQIYSLSNGYHRHLTLTGVRQGEWQSLAVDLTAARRPDGSGGPLAEDERIDDIQFYTDTAAELLIDDIVLYDAAPEGETEPFPRPVFTGWFDTGRQGREWPGVFEQVAHGKWKAARSVGGELSIGLRGRRKVGEGARLRFRHLLRGADHAFFGGRRIALRPDEWGRADIDVPAGAVERLDFRVPRGGELTLDDVLLYERQP